VEVIDIAVIESFIKYVFRSLSHVDRKAASRRSASKHIAAGLCEIGGLLGKLTEQVFLNIPPAGDTFPERNDKGALYDKLNHWITPDLTLRLAIITRGWRNFEARVRRREIQDNVAESLAVATVCE
jgi:hypothetical protein